MSIDTTIKPVSIVAFVLTCLGCVQVVVTISLTNWWSLRYSNGDEVDYGVWRKSFCDYTRKCHFSLSTKLEGGQEAFFISKVFATLTTLFGVIGVVLHIAYFFVRTPILRTVAIFTLGSAGLFGLLATFVFAGFYHSKGGDTSLGIAFIFFVIGSITLLVAAGVTTWAAVRKVSDTRGLSAF